MNGTPTMTARQRQVCRLLCLGCTTKDIARALGLSSHTVKRHIAHLMALSGAENRVQVVVWALGPPAPEVPAPRRPPAGSTGIAGLRPLDVPEARSPEERFWALVERHEGHEGHAGHEGHERQADACWEWHGPYNWRRRPLCAIRVFAQQGLGQSARRIAFMLARGVRLPPDIFVMLHCPNANPRCVTPDHMRLCGRGHSSYWHTGPFILPSAAKEDDVCVG